MISQEEVLLETLLPILKTGYRGQWVRALLAAIIGFFSGGLIFFVFPSMFMGFYRMVGNEFPMIIRLFGIGFFGLILTFIFAGLLESKLLTKGALLFPAFLGSSKKRWGLAILFLVPSFRVSWLISEFFFPFGKFGFQTILTWGGLILALIFLAAQVVWLQRTVTAYERDVIEKVLIPFVSKFGYPSQVSTRTPKKAELNKIFLRSEQSELFVKPDYCIEIEMPEGMSELYQVEIREKVKQRGKSSDDAVFSGLVLVQNSTRGFKKIDFTGIAFHENVTVQEKSNSISSEYPFLAAVELHSLIEKVAQLERIVKGSARFVTFENRIVLLFENAHLLGTGIFPVRAWNRKWLENAVHFCHATREMAQILRNLKSIQQ